MRTRNGFKGCGGALWLLLPSILIAVLWSLNWRLSYPPLSQADLQLRAAIAGANRMEIQYFSCQQQACSANVRVTEQLGQKQMAQFCENLRFLDAVVPPQSGFPLALDLGFWRGRTRLMVVSLSIGEFTTAYGPRSKDWRAEHRLHPLFEAKLRARLPLSHISH